MKKLKPHEPIELKSLRVTVTLLPGTGHREEKGSYPRLNLDGAVSAFDSDQKFEKILEAAEDLLPPEYQFSYRGDEIEGGQLPVYNGRVRYTILLKRSLRWA